MGEFEDGDRSPAISDVGHHALGHSPQGASDTILDEDDDPSGRSPMASVEDANGELISTVLDAVRCLPTNKQAAILLDTSLALIEAGRCGVSRLFFSSSNLPLRADMETKLKIFSKSISRRRGYHKRTQRRRCWLGVLLGEQQLRG